MITKVSGLNPSCDTKDPRRKAQRLVFKNGANIPYKSSYDSDFEYKQQQRNALWTSMSIILGSLLFMGGYLILTKKAKV